MMLRSLIAKTLKILKTVNCPAHVECGVLESFFATSCNVLKRVPDIHGRYTQQEWRQPLTAPTGMYTLFKTLQQVAK